MGPREKRSQHQSTSPPPRPPPNISLVRRPPLVCSPCLCLSRVASRRAVLETGITTATRRRVAKFLDPCSKASTSASRLETGFRESSWSPYVCEYAEVPLVQCRSLCAKFFTTLRSATSSSTTTLVWERNLHVSVYEGMFPKLLSLQHY
jgi:hypothetical protein